MAMLLLKEMSVDEVATFVQQNGCPEAVEVLKSNLVDGEILFNITDDELKTGLGITAFGVRKRLLSLIAITKQYCSLSATELVMKPAAAAVPVPVPDTPTGALGALLSSTKIKRSHHISVEPVIFPDNVKIRNLMKMVKEFKASKPVEEHMRDNLAALPDVTQLEETLQTAVEFVRWNQDLNGDKIAVLHLSHDEQVAVATYTHEPLGERAGTVYFQLNCDLRVRQKAKMDAWCPLLHFIFSALNKLPSFSGTVFRGIDNLEVAEREYKKGRIVFWSAFSSSTSSLEVAKGFVGGGGGGGEGGGRGRGVIFRIQVQNGKRVQLLSAMTPEEEVLLSPNSRFFVSQALHCESGLFFVDLEEVIDNVLWF
eukprot:TRINITY_DN1490_c0_g2_i1.p1 TRINITY_DN1490_c0_g2~~TRINITY_DN1490_c0_g2_i1.p1  ORF type:complete len:382 (-),score=126.59 TRINITY_DN1490_c0_g2_i1:97-1200(-)